MRKSLIGITLVVVLAACNTIPPGNYYVIPVTGTLSQVDYSYCEGSNCYYIQMGNSVFAPTNEFFPTELPIITAEPECWIIPNMNVNVRLQPLAGSTIIGVMLPGMRTRALAVNNNFYKIWWPGNSNFPLAQYGWTSAPLYTTEGNCNL